MFREYRVSLDSALVSSILLRIQNEHNAKIRQRFLEVLKGTFSIDRGSSENQCFYELRSDKPLN